MTDKELVERWIETAAHRVARNATIPVEVDAREMVRIAELARLGLVALEAVGR